MNDELITNLTDARDMIDALLADIASTPDVDWTERGEEIGYRVSTLLSAE
jgi:hypothetical protein